MTDAPAGPPSYYPVSLDLSHRPCLVVGRRAGGGPQGAGPARLRGPGQRDRPRHRRGDARPDRLVGRRWTQRPYRPGDVAGFRLVITATGDPAVDGAVAAEADAAGVWVNSADDPTNCSFILPAVHRDGAVTVAVSTGGLSPALASWLRNQAAASVGSGLDTLARLLSEATTAAARRGKIERERRLGRAARRRAPRSRARRRRRQRQSNSADARPPTRSALVLLSLPALTRSGHIRSRAVRPLRRIDTGWSGPRVHRATALSSGTCEPRHGLWGAVRREGAYETDHGTFVGRPERHDCWRTDLFSTLGRRFTLLVTAVLVLALRRHPDLLAQEGRGRHGRRLGSGVRLGRLLAGQRL